MKPMLKRLDERLKILIAAIGGALPIYFVDWRTQLAVLIAALLLCLAAEARRFIGWFFLCALLLVTVSMGADYLLTGAIQVTDPSHYFGILKFGPMIAMFAFVAVCVNPKQLLHSLESHWMPKRLTLPLVVTLRFLPSVVEEFRLIRYGARIRGLGPNFGRMLRHPLRTLEYSLIPLVLRALTIGDDLARSAAARGINAPGPKSSYHRIRFGRLDLLMLLAWTIFYGAMFYVDERLYSAYKMGDA